MGYLVIDGHSFGEEVGLKDKDSIGSYSEVAYKENIEVAGNCNSLPAFYFAITLHFIFVIVDAYALLIKIFHFSFTVIFFALTYRLLEFLNFVRT